MLIKGKNNREISNGYLGLIISYITPPMKQVFLNLAYRKFDVSHMGEVMAEWIKDELEVWKVWTNSMSS